MMRDVEIELSLGGRIRYALLCIFLCICSVVGFVVATYGLVDDAYLLLHGKRIQLMGTFWGLVGWVVCVLFLSIMPSAWLRQYPVFRAARLEVRFGTASLFSRTGALLAEMKQATVGRPPNGSIWFRKKNEPDNAFEIPLYLVPRSKRKSLLVALGLPASNK